MLKWFEQPTNQASSLLQILATLVLAIEQLVNQFNRKGSINNVKHINSSL